MTQRPLAEVDQNLDGAIERNLAEIDATYDAVREMAGETDDLSEFESYFGVEIRDVIEQLKRARQWEGELESHQRGLLNHQQVIEQIDDDGFSIEAKINRADRSVDSFLETLEQMLDVIESGSELASRVDDLIDQLETQKRQLEELGETVTDAQNALADAGFTWYD